MKNLIIVGVLISLLGTGVGAAVAPVNMHVHNGNLTSSLAFSMPVLQETQGYYLASFQNMNAWVDEPGYPMVPAYRQTYTIPFGSKVTNVQVTFSDPDSQILTRALVPASSPVSLNELSTDVLTYEKNMVAYKSSSLYPTQEFTYTVGAGLDGLTHVLYVTVMCYPVHYRASNNLLNWYHKVEINVQYTLPMMPRTTSSHYDLLIIAPEKFVSALQPLIDAKIAHGINTTLITVEDMVATYSGRDVPEKIKYGIKNELDTSGIHYVLIVGGLDSMIYAIPKDDVNQGTKDWYVPVRYTNLWDGGTESDPGFLCDLYYADIYDGEGNFSTWDSNDDGIFADWRGIRNDIIDLYPDVYVGRLACANTKEVKTLVKKIITYEETTADPAWFNTMVVIGGDTFNDVGGTNFYEGEVENQKALEYMTGFDPVKIWCSNRNSSGLVPVPWDIVTTVSKGCGFLAFAGHGSPERWNTYWCESFDEKRARGLWWWDMPFFYNGKKEPVCVVGGCHNSQFNVTATGFILDQPWVYGPVPETFSWLLMRNPRGGAIATMGNTGIGYGAVGNSGDRDGDGINDPDCVEVLGGYLESLFFKAYGVNHTQNLGAAWGYAITHYLNTYPGMDNKLDCKTVQQWALLGDPSLLIGGYPS